MRIHTYTKSSGIQCFSVIIRPAFSRVMLRLHFSPRVRVHNEFFAFLQTVQVLIVYDLGLRLGSRLWDVGFDGVGSGFQDFCS